MRSRGGVLLVVGSLFVSAAVGQTAWPAFMPRLKAAVSESPVAAVLPPGGESQPPEPTLPVERKRWHGLWQGWACGGRACDVRLAVEQVGPEQATVAFASASAVRGVLAERATGAFENEELMVRLGDGARLVLRLRGDGDMEMSFWKPETQLVSAGVLSKKQIQPVYTRSIERVPTPWRDEDKAQALEMVVYRPLGKGPFPTLIFNHGSTGSGTRSEWFRLTWTSPEVAEYFAGKGWQVLIPQRRGRGQSDGLYDEGFSADRSRGYSCAPERTLLGFDRAMADLDVVMAHVLQRPDVDLRRVLIGGVSRGGILAVGYAGMRPGMFVGVLNFVGGWISDSCKQAAVVNPALARRGAEFKSPMLWIYGDKDPYYQIAHSRANFDAFQAAGGRGDFHAFQPAPGRDGHSLHNEPSIWTSVVDRYLADVGIR